MTKKIQPLSRRGFFAASAGAAAGVTLAAPAAIAQTKTVWRMQTHWPTGNWYYEDVFVKFCNRITAATGGELTIEPHAPKASCQRARCSTPCVAACWKAPSSTPPIGLGACLPPVT